MKNNRILKRGKKNEIIQRKTRERKKPISIRLKHVSTKVDWSFTREICRDFFDKGLVISYSLPVYLPFGS